MRELRVRPPNAMEKPSWEEMILAGVVLEKNTKNVICVGDSDVSGPPQTQSTPQDKHKPSAHEWAGINILTDSHSLPSCYRMTSTKSIL